MIDGRFKSEFIIPKDIKYNFGTGRIVMYAVDAQQGLEANGYFSDVVIGGDAKDAIIEHDGPELKIYLNTPYFENGGEVDQNPLFVAELNDVSGINTIGSGIGHDLILKLDNDIKSNTTIIEKDNIRMIVSDSTSKLVPDRKCSTNICKEIGISEEGICSKCPPGYFSREETNSICQEEVFYDRNFEKRISQGSADLSRWRIAGSRLFHPL